LGGLGSRDSGSEQSSTSKHRRMGALSFVEKEKDSAACTAHILGGKCEERQRMSESDSHTAGQGNERT
jgi:hypothetical protein